MTVALPESYGNQGVRIAPELQYGVLPGTPAWKVLNDVKLVPKPQFETDMFMASGMEVPTVGVLNDDFTNFDATGRLSYTSLMYILSSLFGYPTSAVVTGTTKDHVWDWDGKTPVVPASFALDYGAARIRRVLGVVFNGLTAGIARTGLDFGTSAFGKDTNIVATPGGVTAERQTITITGTPTAGTFTPSFKGVAVPTGILYNATAATLQAALEALPTIGVGGVIVGGGPGPATPYTVDFVKNFFGTNPPLLTFTHALTGGTTPAVAATETTAGADAATQIPAQPIFPLHFDVYADDTWAAAVAGTTKLLALYNFGLGLGERLDRSRPVNSARTSDSVFLRDEQEHTASLRMGADATAEALYTNIRSGAMKFVRLMATGPATGDASLKYEFEAIMCLLLTGTDGYDTESGIHVMTWNSRIARDPVSLMAAKFRLRNKQAGL